MIEIDFFYSLVKTVILNNRSEVIMIRILEQDTDPYENPTDPNDEIPVW